MRGVCEVYFTYNGYFFNTDEETRNKEKEYCTKSKFNNKKDVDNAIAHMIAEEEDFKWRNNL